VPGIEPGPPDLEPRTLTTRPQRRSVIIIIIIIILLTVLNLQFLLSGELVLLYMGVT
jgi:hypothetical protein